MIKESLQITFPNGSNATSGSSITYNVSTNESAPHVLLVTPINSKIPVELGVNVKLVSVWLEFVKIGLLVPLIKLTYRE